MRYQQICTPCIVGRTVLLIGIGEWCHRAAAGKAGVQVVGVRRSGKPLPDVDRMATAGELPAVRPEADIVVLALSLTPQTRNLLDRRRIGLMKRGGGFLTSSPGGNRR